MNFLTVKQYSEIWEISERRIIKLCTEGRIPGAIKNGKSWNIPENTIKPADKRNNVSKYINTEKRIAILGFDKSFGNKVISLLMDAGFLVDVITNEIMNIENANVLNVDKNCSLLDLEKITNKYYEGLIFIENQNLFLNVDKEKIINVFAKKMHCNSSIVYVNTKPNSDLKFIKTLSKKLKYEIGLRLNALKLTVEESKNILIDYNDFAEDIVELIMKFKNTTGMILETDSGSLEFDSSGKTKILGNGEFYKAIDNTLKKLDKTSYFWCASTMLEDEWTEEPKEMNFRVSNLEMANCGIKVERIFVFSHSKIKEFKNNKTLKIFMQSNIDTMYVDLDEILEEEPKLLEILGDGWDGIDKTTLIVDTPSDKKGEARGYLTINKREIEGAFECYLKLKTYAKKLKDVLK